MRKDGSGFSVAVWSAVAVAAVGLGVIVAFLAGYFLGHSTGHGKTTTVSIAAAPSSGVGESEETPEPAPAEEETSEPEEAGAGEAASGKEASGAESAMLATGKGIVESTCSSCHTLSEAGATGTVGPNLDELKPSKATVEQQVTNGGAIMPAFKGTLSSAEIEAVAEYVSKVAGAGNSSAG